MASRVAADNTIQTRRKMARELDDADARIDRLTLLCESLWSLLCDTTDLTEEDLHRRLNELDDADGRSDFRRQKAAIPCECGAMIPPKALHCQFCGAPAPLPSLFDAV